MFDVKIIFFWFKVCEESAELVMSYKANSVHLHGENYQISSASICRLPSNLPTTLVSTNKFSTLVVAVDEGIVAYDFEDCNNDDVVDDYEECDLETSAKVPELMTPQQLTEQEMAELEAKKDEDFFQTFMSDIHKPALDSHYKYPKISIMVSVINASYF